MTTKQIAGWAGFVVLAAAVFVLIAVNVPDPVNLPPPPPPPARIMTPGYSPLGIIGVPCTPGQHCAPRRCTEGLSQNVAWPMHVVNGGIDGADGVDVISVTGDARPEYVATCYEQAGACVGSRFPSADLVQKMWPTVTIATGIPGAEDAKWGDMDADGFADLIVAGQSTTTSIRILFSPTSNAAATWLSSAQWTGISLTAASGVDSWIQVARADINGDGHQDAIGGGRSLAPSTIRIFTSPGPGAYRTAGSWTVSTAGNVGWTMSLIPMDVDGDTDIDLVISDRDNGASLRGVRYLENQSSGTVWVNHTIFVPATGEETKFITIADMDGDVDLDIVATVSGTTYNRVFLLTNPGAWSGSWTSAELAAPSNVGEGQGPAVGDIDGDGDLDIAITYANCTGKSCAVYLAAPTWSRQEISGVSESKLDNGILIDLEPDGDLDLLTASQREGSGTQQRGVIIYENCRAP